MKFSRARLDLLGFLALAFCLSSSAGADELFLGKWKDNAPNAERIGDVEITQNKIVFRRHVSYDVKHPGAFGAGAVYAVTGADRKNDPEGCGPTGRTRYIAIEPLPPVVGAKEPAMRIYFYGGDKAPDPATIADDRALCSIHPFVRG